METQRIHVGFIAKTHGLKGEVSAMLEQAVDWSHHTVALIEQNGTPVSYTIERVSGQAAKPILKLEGVDVIEQAAALKGCRLYLSMAGRPKSKPGSFYDDEVIGFAVNDETLGFLGQVQEIQSHGANRLMQVIGVRELLIPLNGPFIKSVNKTKKVITVALPDGFTDL